MSMRLHAIILVVLLTCLTACSSLHRVSADEFIRLASKPPESLFGSSYIGYSHGAHVTKVRVYLQVWRMGLFGPLWGDHSGSVDLYWTPLSGFSPEVAAQILAGHDPWSDAGR